MSAMYELMKGLESILSDKFPRNDQAISDAVVKNTLKTNFYLYSGAAFT